VQLTLLIIVLESVGQIFDANLVGPVSVDVHMAIWQKDTQYHCRSTQSPAAAMCPGLERLSPCLRQLRSAEAKQVIEAETASSLSQLEMPSEWQSRNDEYFRTETAYISTQPRYIELARTELQQSELHRQASAVHIRPGRTAERPVLRLDDLDAVLVHSSEADGCSLV
jgi:hypothetical protein